MRSIMVLGVSVVYMGVLPFFVLAHIFTCTNLEFVDLSTRKVEITSSAAQAALLDALKAAGYPATAD